MQIHLCEQGSEQWHAVKKGKMSASHAQEIANAGAGLTSYIYEMMAEVYSSAPKETYTNEDMERGVTYEADARSLYELERGVTVETVGFVETDEYVGCSPDGCIGEEGLIEIKSHNEAKHLRLFIEGVDGIESKYIWQMQMQMMLTDRKWCDYVAFNPNFKQTLIIHRIEADPEAHEKLRKGLEKGKKLIEEIKAKL